MDVELNSRINLLYVAIGRTVERDLTKFPARIFSDDQGKGILQDFSNGMSEAEISYSLLGLIHNIGSFHDHLKKWGETNGVSGGDIHNYFKDSFDFCVVRDLWNNDKHGYPPDKNDGWSRRAPRLKNVSSTCRLSAGTAANSSVMMLLGKEGRPIIQSSGGGAASVIFTGEVVDKNGNNLGDAHVFNEAAVSLCESAIQRFVPS